MKMNTLKEDVEELIKSIKKAKNKPEMLGIIECIKTLIIEDFKNNFIQFNKPITAFS